MITEIVTTGTELLLGEIANENAQWLASFLNEHGYTVAYMTVVGDNPRRMEEAFRTALSRADLVITSGGLGSTLGDITKKAGAQAMGLSLIHVEEESKRLKKYYEDKKRPFLSSLDRQAWFAEGAHLFPNDAGSASGCALCRNGKILVHLPGPPFEMKTMMRNHVMPWLTEKLGSQGLIRSLVLSAVQMTEAEIEEKIGDLLRNQSNPTLALLARPGYVAVRITARGADEAEVMELIENMAEKIEGRIRVSRYHLEGDVLNDLHHLLLQEGFTVSAAESCTGGLIGKFLTDNPGSSSYFKGSAVTYWNEAKEKVLSVRKDTLDELTAVSGPVAAQMAEGSRNLYGSDIAVSTTGYAGPGRGERGEEPGLVYIGITGPLGTKVYQEQFFGSRRSVRYGAAEKALYYILSYAERLKEKKKDDL